MSPQPVIRKLDIARFRGLNALSLDNLSHVNVLVGANNCGKTSVLEAVMLLGAPNSFRTVKEMALYRVSPSEEQEEENRIDYLLSIFQQRRDGTYIVDLGAEVNEYAYRYQIKGELEKKLGSFRRNGEALRLRAINPNAVSSEKKLFWKATVENGEDYDFDDYYDEDYDGDSDYFDDNDDNDNETGYYKHSSVNDNFYTPFYLPASKVNHYRMASSLMIGLAKIQKKPDVLKVLRIFDPDIEGIDILGSELYLTHKHIRSLPLYAYGYGLQKVASLVTATINMEGGVLLIDEIENAIHMSAFQEVFHWFMEACLQYHVQAFVTTHSAEALDAVLHAAYNRCPDKDILRVITLRKDQEANITRKIIRTGKEAYEDRARFEEELRV